VASDDFPGLHPAGGRSPMRKRQMALTEQERQVLLADLAEITAELDAIQERTAEITARVARRTSVHLVRPA
jgi:hypothetical protein